MFNYKGKSIAVPPQETRKCKLHNLDGHDYFVPVKYTPRRSLTSKAPYGIGPFWTFFTVEDRKNVTILKIDDPFKNVERAQVVLREIRLLRHLNHPNIIALKDVISQEFDQHSFQEVYMVYEMMDSNLHTVIHSGTVCSNDYCRKMLYQILCGLKYVHSANTLAYLKPANMFLNDKNVLKLGDFGVTLINSQTDMMSKSLVRPPEKLAEPPIYHPCNNVWSAGVVFMQLLSSGQILPGAEKEQHLSMIVELLGTPPTAELLYYSAISIETIMNMPDNPRIPLAQKFPNFDPLAMDLAQKMLAFIPTERITVDEAIHHPYLQSVRCSENEKVCTEPFDVSLLMPSWVSVEVAKIMLQEAANCFTT